MVNKRQKGAELENYVADKIIEKGLDSRCRRDGGSGSGNREKADICTDIQIFGRNLGIEVKNAENLQVNNWWKQTEKLEQLNREPVLIYKLPKRNPKVLLASIYLDTFLDMVRALQDVDNVSSNVVENYNFDKTQHLNSLIYAKEQLSRAIREYKKRILKEE